MSVDRGNGEITLTVVVSWLTELRGRFGPRNRGADPWTEAL